MTVAQLKARLARELRDWIAAQPLSQRELAPHLKLHQPQISWLMTGKGERLPLENLLRAWFALGGRLSLEKRRRNTP